MKKGVIVRDMNAYGFPEWIRVSVGTMVQNERFIAELRELLGAPARGGAALAGA
jgi:histidinol-phosphate aminotransferase